VKTLRKKVEDVNNSNEEFRTVNGNLENAISELQKQLDSQKTRFETLLTEAIANSTSSVTATGDQGAPAEDDNLTTTADLVQNALKASSVA
jgi:DNA repair exonuclease SbcCD ATPase subunit